MSKAPKSVQKQLLHLVVGGEVETGEAIVFKELNAVDLVGLYPTYAAAQLAWKSKAQQTVDNAEMRYFVVHLHRLLNPEDDEA